MVKGFEDLTKDINKEERRLVLEASRILRSCNGKASAIKNQELREEIKTRTGISLRPERIRKLIGYIRTKGIITGLVATAKGYYISDSEEDFLNFIRSLDDRIKSIASVRNALEDQFSDKYNKTILRTLGVDSDLDIVVFPKGKAPTPYNLDPDFFDDHTSDVIEYLKGPKADDDDFGFR